MEAGQIVYKSTKNGIEEIDMGQAPEELIEALEDLARNKISPIYVFANPKTGLPYAPNTCRRHLEVACEKAGVDVFTPHQIRHQGTITGLERTDGDVDAVQRWGGWRSGRMITSVYGKAGRRMAKLVGGLEDALAEERARLEAEREAFEREKKEFEKARANVVQIDQWRRKA